MKSILKLLFRKLKYLIFCFYLFRLSPYRPSPELFNITNENELVFHFKPLDQNIILKKILTTVNMTLIGFGSSVYSFYIEPSKNYSNHL
jgi:hypothetical protein